MDEMARKEIIPAVLEYVDFLSKTAANKRSLSPDIPVSTEISTVKELSACVENMTSLVNQLEEDLQLAKKESDIQKLSRFFANTVLEHMEALRESADKAEHFMPKKYWPFPSYSELLYKI